VELLIAGDEPDEPNLRSACAPRRSVQPQSPGGDLHQPRHRRRAHGVLACLGLPAISNGCPATTAGRGARDAAQGGPERVPSRVHTALEASLNCEVHIRTT
jgi:hypothetical protein